MIWLLGHSTGAAELDLGASEADFTVGCRYKYLDSGPRVPAFIHVARRHKYTVPSLYGWLGHARGLAFEQHYDPAPGIVRFHCGTLELVVLESGVD